MPTTIVVRQSDTRAFISHGDPITFLVDTKKKYRYVFMSATELYSFMAKLPEWSPLKKSLANLASEIKWKSA